MRPFFAVVLGSVGCSPEAAEIGAAPAPVRENECVSPRSPDQTVGVGVEVTVNWANLSIDRFGEVTEAPGRASVSVALLDFTAEQVATDCIDYAATSRHKVKAFLGSDAISGTEVTLHHVAFPEPGFYRVSLSDEETVAFAWELVEATTDGGAYVEFR